MQLGPGHPLLEAGVARAAAELQIGERGHAAMQARTRRASIPRSRFCLTLKCRFGLGLGLRQAQALALALAKSMVKLARLN